MAAVTARGSIFDTTAGSHQVNATPAVGELMFILAAASDFLLSGGATPTDNNADGSGTYSYVGSFVSRSSTDSIAVFVRNALIGSATTTTFTHNPGTTTGGGFQLFGVSSCSVAGLPAVRGFGGENNIPVGNTPAPVLKDNAGNTQAALSTNPIIGLMQNHANPPAITPPASFTEQVDTGWATPTTGVETVRVDSGITASTITWGSAAGTGQHCSMVVEVNAGPDYEAPPMPGAISLPMSLRFDSVYPLELRTQDFAVEVTDSYPAGDSGIHPIALPLSLFHDSVSPLELQAQYFDYPSAAAPIVSGIADLRSVGRMEAVGLGVEIARADLRSAARMDSTAIQVALARGDLRSAQRLDAVAKVLQQGVADLRSAARMDATVLVLQQARADLRSQQRAEATGAVLVIAVADLRSQQLLAALGTVALDVGPVLPGPIALPMTLLHGGIVPLVLRTQEFAVPTGLVTAVADLRAAGRLDATALQIALARADLRSAGRGDATAKLLVISVGDLRSAQRLDATAKALVLGRGDLRSQGRAEAVALQLALARADLRTAGRNEAVTKVLQQARADLRAGARADATAKLLVKALADLRSQGRLDATFVLPGALQIFAVLDMEMKWIAADLRSRWSVREVSLVEEIIEQLEPRWRPGDTGAKWGKKGAGE